MSAATVAAANRRGTVGLRDLDLHATVSRKDLLEAVSFAAWAVPGRPAVHVLLGIRLTATPGGLRAAAYNYETYAEQTVAALGSQGDILVPGRLLLDMLRTLPAGADVVLDSRERVLRMTAGAEDREVQFRVPLLSLADYPIPPSVESEPQAQIDGATLRLLCRPAVAAGRDDTLPVLTAVYLHAVEGLLVAAGTDRYRLAVATSEVAWAQPPALLPARVGARAAFAFGKAKQVGLTVTKNGPGEDWLTFTADSRTVITRTLEGEFPRYASLVPKNSTGRLEVDRDLLAETIQQAQVTAPRSAPLRLVLVEGGKPAIHAGGDHDGDAGMTATITGAYTGPSLSVAFNPRYLLDGLATLPPGPVLGSFQGDNRPAVFRSPLDDAFLYLLMPVRLSG